MSFNESVDEFNYEGNFKEEPERDYQESHDKLEIQATTKEKPKESPQDRRKRQSALAVKHQVAHISTILAHIDTLLVEEP